ncbi:MAG TPA: PepSY-associated TM helix domain-containing protein [Pseudacidobacterium sp.]|jgi:uncharacterized iron-regulated membrane protein|nr:PepSY-associated TM helix domain-containing protein [Pseudacidobacterium sp.]
MSVTPRRVLFWLHLTAGVIAGTVIFFLSVTGTCLAFERQMIGWADGSHRIVPHDGMRQPLSALIENVQNYAHAPATAIAVHGDSSLPLEVTVGREPARVVLVDPYSGAIVGESAPRLRKFFAEVTALHRWFGMQGDNRAVARSIKGAFTLAMLFLVCSGIVLWMPRKWTRNRINKSLFFRRDLEGRARDWNRHNVIGIWLAVPLLVIVLTGVIMAYPWANDLLYRLAGNALPPQQSETVQRGTTHAHGNHAVATVPRIETLMTVASQQIPDWRTITVRLNPVTLQVDRGDGGRPDLRTQITLNDSGRVLRTESFSSYNKGRQLRAWARFTHTGEAGGIVGEIIAVVASIGAAALAWTGFALALRRLPFPKNKRLETSIS